MGVRAEVLGCDGWKGRDVGVQGQRSWGVMGAGAEEMGCDGWKGRGVGV